MSICVIITAYNEEDNIEECILQAKLLTDNIIVIDTNSTDKTAKLAQKAKVKIISAKYYRYVEPTRNLALQTAKTNKYDWVFLLDADERITEKLASEIKKTIKNDKFSYYLVSRQNIFARRKWFKYGGFGPKNDQQIRLIKVNTFVNWPKAIHSTPVIKGQTAKLQNLLIHYFHPNFESMVKKTSVFEDIESDLLYQAKKKVNILILFRKFIGEFYRRLIKYQGWRDGAFGVIESIYQAYSKTITHLYLYEKQKKGITD